MQYVLFEDLFTTSFLPLTFTRPVYDLRFGIDTLKEKWERYLGQSCLTLGHQHLRFKYSKEIPAGDTIYINGRMIPDALVMEQVIQALGNNQGFIRNDNELIAFRTDTPFLDEEFKEVIDISVLPMYMELYEFASTKPIRMIEKLTDLFTKNKEQIIADFKNITHHRGSFGIHDRYTIVYNPDNVFVEEGAKIRAAIINAEDGPVYIGKNAVISEGSIIIGANAINEGVIVQPGTKLRGDSTIGPYCKVGGEISNSVIHSYSNKNHDGFLGNSVIGSWCNLGANTNVSNLKNNYSTVKIHNHKRERLVDTGLQFCGLLMGDYCRTGINTMFNTGTMVDTCANVFGAGFPPKHIPSFSWHSIEENEVYDFTKAISTIEKMMARRDKVLTMEERMILLYLFEQTAKKRKDEYL